MIQTEEKRLAEVRKFLRLDFNKKNEFKDIVDIAARLCEKPVALITLLDEESNWLKVRSGVDVDVMPRDTSFCHYAIQQDEILIIPDATKDARFTSNPLVRSGPKLRFYAGVPLKLSNGIVLGSLCLFDIKPGNITILQQQVLALLGRQVVSFMELGMSRLDLEKQIEEKEAKNESLRKIAQLQSHQIRQPLTTIMGLVNLVKDGHQPVNDEWIDLFKTATHNFDTTIHQIVAETMARKDLKAIRFNKMVEEIDDYAILLIDRDGNIENWNKGAEKIKGYAAAEIIGRHFSIFYTDEDRKNNRPQKLIDRAARKGVARDEGWRVRKRVEVLGQYPDHRYS
ncbi:MAG TPA: GAF domain-containing protein [Mucilaginibacter sp.]|nr:GAF domain-containing protein [Mucilaginibacter sp.]